MQLTTNLEDSINNTITIFKKLTKNKSWANCKAIINKNNGKQFWFIPPFIVQKISKVMKQFLKVIT